MAEESPLDLISEITELNDLSDFMQDEHLDRALNIILKLIVKNDVPPVTAARLLVELQAISAKCAVLGTYYATLSSGKAGSVNNHKKHIYKSIKEALDRLVDSIKYLAKQG
jgi:hypothetical protein